MNGIERRIRKLEDEMQRHESGDLSDLNDAEIDLARGAVCRELLARAATDEDRAPLEDKLRDIATARAVLRSNLGPHDGGVDWVRPSCGCDALPYRHHPHRTADQLAAFVATWAESRTPA